VDELNLRHESQSLLWEQALVDSDFVTVEDFLAAALTGGELESMCHHVKTYDDQVKKLQAELGLLKEQLKGKHRLDLEKLQQSHDELNTVFKAAEGLWAEASQYLTKLSDTQKKIEQITQEQEEIAKQYEVVGVLSKAASGRGNVRVSLERFVLGNILDQVLSIASQRLHTMSKGQYRLIRQNEKYQKKNTTAGLDLAIDDAYTGKARPVATLSGGESFMASLALALGLSDVVQERSGGIQLDTLFIDEGFGSLDQESLQLAINTLVTLQSTGRTIGIISHVSELKEQMSQRIEVVGSRRGSCIRMVTF
jgi:exonuclease SbcC